MTTAADILEEMANTYRERNKVYGDNFKTVGPLMQQLYPGGMNLDSANDYELFHLWTLLLVKVTRFVNSEHRHIDSCHDISVYAAMIEAILRDREATAPAPSSPVTGGSGEYIPAFMRTDEDTSGDHRS
jgi:hypothetical protein